MEIIVQKREIFGKKVKFLRKKGFIPAELYGHNQENIHLSVPIKDFLRLFMEAGESTVIKLKIENDKENKELNVLIHNIQKDHLSDNIVNIDFYQVKMDEEITVAVSLEFIGEAPVVKEKVGILVKAVKEVEVRALPADLPHTISVELGSLSEIRDSICVKDLKVSEKVKILSHPETVIATITELAKEEETVKPLSVEDIKVEGEEKKERSEKEKTE